LVYVRLGLGGGPTYGGRSLVRVRVGVRVKIKGDKLKGGPAYREAKPS